MVRRQLVDTRARYGTEEEETEKKVRRMDEHREPFTHQANALWDDETLDAYQKAVYCAIKRHDWGNGFPLSVATIAAKAGCKPSKAQRTIRSLEQRGMVHVEAQEGRPSVYRALPPDQWTPVPRTAPPGQNTAPTPVPRTGDPGTTYRPTPVPRTAIRRHSKKTKEDTTAPSGAGADAPPPAAQNQEPTLPKSEKPATASAPYVIAEALLTAQNRVPTPALCRQHLKAVKEHITDAYREHPARPGTADALSCIAYLQTDPWIAEDVGRLTPRLLGSRLGPWLKAGRPTAYSEKGSDGLSALFDPKRDMPRRPPDRDVPRPERPPSFDPVSGKERRLCLPQLLATMQRTQPEIEWVARPRPGE